MIIGLCGTHGTGKSTLLRSLREAEANVCDVQISRQVQNKLGWEKLSLVTDSVENMWAFQEAVLQAIYDRDTVLEKTGDVVIVDRTPVDVWAYTAIWCYRLGINTSGLHGSSERAKAHKALCRTMAARYALFISIPLKKEISFEAHPNRADEESREFVQTQVNSFLIHGGLPTHELKSVSVSERVAEVLGQVTLVKLGVRKRNI